MLSHSSTHCEPLDSRETKSGTECLGSCTLPATSPPERGKSLNFLDPSHVPQRWMPTTIGHSITNAHSWTHTTLVVQRQKPIEPNACLTVAVRHDHPNSRCLVSHEFPAHPAWWYHLTPSMHGDDRVDFGIAISRCQTDRHRFSRDRSSPPDAPHWTPFWIVSAVHDRSAASPVWSAIRLCRVPPQRADDRFACVS